MADVRKDDFQKRRKHLDALSDYELKEYFWQLAEQVVHPLLDLAKTHTTPSIERSILLRMGFSSIEAKGIVQQVIANDFIGKGAGHVVYRYSKLANISIKEAGLALLDGNGFEELKKSFGRNV